MSHAAYLTYDEYIGYGGTLAQTDFILAEFKARKRIDYLTDSRVQDMKTVPEAVKLCCMTAIGMITTVGAEAQATKPTVTSFSTDGYSETMGNSMNAADGEKQINSTIAGLLYGECDDEGTPLLYRGVR